MVATTIPNSGGPGSPHELSPITIAVRDKVIEKFQHEPLDQMNESVKKLLSQETDEQKRLGILAARVYILRQRIAMLSSQDQERVVSSSSPSPENTGATAGAEPDAGDEAPREWTRLRILEDCEVNGVRFPKTVIIDVKSEDAQRLIDSGNAELIEEQPQAEPAATEEPDKDVAEAQAEASDQTEEAVAEAAAEQQPEDAPAEDPGTAEQTEDAPAEDRHRRADGRRAAGCCTGRGRGIFNGDCRRRAQGNRDRGTERGRGDSRACRAQFRSGGARRTGAFSSEHERRRRCRCRASGAQWQ